ncbi:unnamed protein product [Prorocentrum cordatum]|uniref:Protein kinase domain-containing protein n=1 Tax=Prorocentrum cordatum TaxID=2364126 RepID=A0ABN9VBD4_9DINO|nr:unnamed protein product [Polarella glacialis]
MISHLWCGGPPSQGSDAGWQEEALTARSLSADSGRPEGECCACARLFRCLLVQQPCAGSGAHVAKTGSFEAAVRRDLSPSAGNTFSFLASDTDFGEASVELRGAAAWQRTESLRNGRFVKEYKIGEMLGQGAFGIVFAAKRRKPTDSEGNMLAVKLIDKVETHPGDIEREAAIHAKLDHPNILKVHDVIDERFFVCIVTDRFPGGDLVKCLHGCQRLKPSKTMHIVKQMLEGVCYLHNLAIVHRDVKADNFLTEKEEFLDPDCRVILADFGFACYCRTGDRLQRRCGTKMYWAPEIWDRNYAVKVDVWAVGVTVYGMMEGTFPFRTEWDMKSKVLCIEQIHVSATTCEPYPCTSYF